MPASSAQIGYLGPPGSWTHQACIDLFGASNDLVPMAKDALFEAYANHKIEKLCIPVTTSVVGVTPYIDDVLAIPGVMVVAEYPKMLGYSLLAKPNSRREDIKVILVHPVALEEVKPWIDKEMPTVERRSAASGGAAAQTAANSNSMDMASMGPAVGAEIYGLTALVDGIEEGPHNVTRWWVLGQQLPEPTGNDKTSILASVKDEQLTRLLATFLDTKVNILVIYERPSKKTIDSHSYLIEVSGHASEEPLKSLLAAHGELKLLGSYPRKY